jgi:branched-chain amino acid aminotransferase
VNKTTNRISFSPSLPTYHSELQFANSSISHDLITAQVGSELTIEYPLANGGESIFEPTAQLSLKDALSLLAELGIIRFVRDTQECVQLVKLTERVRPAVKGGEGDLSWHLTRLQELGQEVTSIEELLRLNQLVKALGVTHALGSHSFRRDSRNASILISIDGVVYRRSEARVPALDRGLLLGDGIWESFRIENRHILFFDQHMERFDANVRQLQFPHKPREWYRAQLIELLRANRMESGVHVRFIVTRGDSITPFQSPKVAYGGPRVIIIPEYKSPAVSARGLHLILSPYRRSRSDMFSPELHVTSKVPDIINMIHAEEYGADEPLLLDDNGNIKAGSSTCFFLVKEDTVIVPPDDNMLQGVTRQIVMNLVSSHTRLKLQQKIISTHDLYKGTEAFVTGTAGGISAVSKIGNMIYSAGDPGPVTSELINLYQARLKHEAQIADYSLADVS